MPSTQLAKSFGHVAGRSLQVTATTSLLKPIIGISLRLLVLSLVVQSGTTWAQLDFEKPPIDYGKIDTNDSIAKLGKALAAGEIEFQYDPDHGESCKEALRSWFLSISAKFS